MKSKKILAMVVAFAAFMATATSGLAQVTTTTTYNEVADKVVVDVDVTEATEGSEVTYLVKNSADAIVYIDQKTADSAGVVGFDYKIAKDKITNLVTTVQFGTNGAAPIADTTPLKLNAVTDSGNNYTIKYYSDANCENELTDSVITGTEDEIYAVIAPANGYNLVSVEGATAIAEGSATYKLNNNVYSIVVTTEEAVKTPVVVPVNPSEDTPSFEFDGTVTEGEGEEEVTYTVKTAVIKVEGKPEAVGVIYNGKEYPALTMNKDKNYVESDYYAVRIIDILGEIVSDITTYYDVDGNRVELN